jgi:hypothetical protein
MRTFLDRAFFPTAVFVILLTAIPSPGWGESANQLPPGFAALVPQGAKVRAPGFAKTQGNATVTFSATKPVKNDQIMYRLELHCFADKFWKGLEPTYRQLLEQDVEKQRKQFASHVQHHSGTGPGAEVYPPEVKAYSWGKGVTQRTDTHKVGEISGKVLPVVTTYECAYFGLANRSTFKMSVGGLLENLAEANEWAARIGAKAEQTNLGNIGN